MTNSLSGRSIVVTGAGSGIGRAVAVDAARNGASVTLVGRRREALAATVAELPRTARSSALVLPADVADECTGELVARTVVERFGRIDGLVNNAGVARFAAIEQARMQDLELMWRIHVAGPVRLVQSCLPQLRERRGSIVNVTSVGGALATPGRSFYGATKSAINHLTRSLAVELAPTVRVNAVLPGPVDTPIYDDLGIGTDDTAHLRSALTSMTPMARFGTSSEVGRWVCLLLGDTAAWMTGVLLPVDGGRCA